MKGFITGKGKGTYDETNPIEASNLLVIGGDSGVKSVTGDLVDNTDPNNPVINFPEIPDSGVLSVTGKWVNNEDPANPVVFNNNYVRKLQIPHSSLISFDEAGILQYINYQMPVLPDGPFTIEEDEIFVIEVTGIPTDGDGGDTPDVPTVWTMTSPNNSSSHKEGTIIQITTNYDGETIPSKIEHVVNGVVRTTFTTNLLGQHNSSFTPDNIGTYVIEAKLYFSGELYPEVHVRTISVTPIVDVQSLILHSPPLGSTFMVGESFDISSEYNGPEIPGSVIRHYVDGEPLEDIFPGTSNVINTSTITLSETGTYEISAQILVDGFPVNDVIRPVRQITVVAEVVVNYIPISKHKAGNNDTQNPITIIAPGWSGDSLLRRVTANGTIREDEKPFPHITPTPYLAGDINSITTPLNEITIFKYRFQQTSEFLFNFSTHMPKIEEIWLRGNWMNLSSLNLSGCKNLRYLDVSRNHINSLSLPPANSPQNIFEFAYVGDYGNEGQAPRQVINTIMEYAYYSNYTGPKESLKKILNTGPNVGTINHLGMNFHKLLVDKGWEVHHISIEEEIFFNSSNAATKQSPFMCSHFNWTARSHASWITVSNTNGFVSNNVQNLNVSVTANTTGTVRTGIITVHKWKTDGSGEYHYKGEIIVRQVG